MLKTAFIAVTAAAVVICIPLLPFFCVRQYDGSGRVLLPVGRPGRDSFVLSYTHSVNKGRVEDYFEIADDRSLLLLKTRFVNYGAGMGEPDDGGLFVSSDGYLEMRDLNRSMPKVVLAVGLIADHVIESGGKLYRLTDYFPPQRRIVLEYTRISVLDYLRRLQQ